MPAKSKSQQKLFGMVHAYQKGELKNPSEKVKKIAKSISKKDAKDFAKNENIIKLNCDKLSELIAESIKRNINELMF